MVYEIFYSIVYVLLAQLFYSAFLRYAGNQNNVRIGITVLWMLVVFCVSNMLEEILAVRVAVAIVINFAFSLLLFERKKITKNVFVAVMVYIIAIACDLVVMAVHKIFDPDMKIAEIMDTEVYVYSGVVSQLIQTLVIFLIRRLLRKTKETEIKSNLWVIYLTFPLYSLSLIVLLAYSFDGPISSGQANLFVYFAISLLLINLFVYWFIRQESQRNLDYHKNRMEIDHAKEIVQLYDQISVERTILGKREHEFKNTITALRGLLADGQYEKMKELMDVQKTELLNNTNVFETGNKLINTILNTKYAEAREKGIVFRFLINDLSAVHIEDRDCIVILSNMLNNAIEATEKSKSKNRTISIKAIVEDGQFIFAVRNPNSGGCYPEFKSKKIDVVSHGYGIENIKEAVSRNSGDCFFEERGGEFVSVAIIPL